MRRVLHDGRTPRPLQEKALRKSWPQSPQRAGEAVREDATFEIAPEHALGVGGAGRSAVILRGQHGLEMALHHLVEHRFCWTA